MPSVHEGHRQRLKQRFLKSGLDDFEPHNVLELLLFYAVPQKDTNELAHRLIKHFGSLSAVLDADYEDLCKVSGIGASAATLIKLMPSLFRRYQEDYNRDGVVLTDIAQIGDFLRPKFIGQTKEKVYLLCLDNKGSVVYSGFIIEGTVNSAPMYVRNILEIAMRCQAVAAILAHNHPRGLAIPSNPDILATKAVYNALEIAKIKLMDHFIFAGGDYVSLRNSGFFEF